jgi:hypothetical protein
MNHKLSWAAPSLGLRLGLALAVACAGCATTSADFKMSSLAADDAAIAGRLTVMYNGRIFTDNCRAQFGDSSIKLATGGIVLFKVRKGWTSLKRLDCHDTSNQHIQIKGAHFFARGDGTVSDFGDVAITWAAAGGFKASSLFGMIGAMVDEASDDGVASVEVQPPVAEVRDAFRRQTGVDGSWHVHQMSQPVRGPDAPPAPIDPDAAPSGPRGFFCAGGSQLQLCERDQATCLRDLQILREPPSACTAAETAWCYADGGKLRCFASEKACHGYLQQAAAPTDDCGEQY